MKNKLFQFVIVISVLGVSALISTQVNAQSTGLGITPRKEATLLPGRSFNDTLVINNLNKEVPLKVTLSVVDFKSTNETGTPSLQLDAKAPQTPWSLKPFIVLPQTVDIGPGETKNVDYSIRIPEGQGAGSYYSAVRYSAQSTGGQNVTVSASAATLVFVTVPGRATELMNLKEFGAYEINDKQTNGQFKSLFISSQPQKLAYLLENVGNVAEHPSGSIVIKNMFGKQVKLIEKANPKGNLALIGQTRRFETCIQAKDKTVGTGGDTTTVQVCDDPKLFPGMYRAHLSTFYGVNGSQSREIEATAAFWYLPLWFIGVVLVFLAVLAFVIYKLRKSLVGATIHRRPKRR